MPLPPGAPEAFSGAVGSFSMRATLSREEVEVGEPIQLDVSLMGSGNLAMLEAPSVATPQVFERYDPEVQVSINRDGDLISGYKRFVYLLVPRSNGRFVIPAIEFAYFDPAKEEYTTLRAMPPAVMVSGTGTTGGATGTTNAGFPVDDISPLLSDSPWVRPASPPLHTSPWGYVAIGLPLLLYGLLYTLRHRTTRLAIDTAYARQQRAHPLARKHLRQARLHLRSNGDPRQYYAELEHAIMGFIGNCLNVRELGMTRSQIETLLEETGISHEVRNMVKQLLDACDTGRFAPVAPNTQAMEQSLEEASRGIVMLDAAFRDV